MKRDFKIWAGNTGTVENPDGIVLRFRAGGDIEDLTGSQFVIRAVNSVNGVEVLRKNGDSGVVVDASEGTVTIPITLAESRSLPPRSRYEIEQRLGATQRVRLYGAIVVLGGVNDD